MFYELQQKKSEFYVKVKVPREIKRGAINSEFQFLDHKEISIELDDDYGTDFPDFIMAEDYVPMISNKLKLLFDSWDIDNLYYKRILLKMTDYDLEEVYWLALPPRIDCLDPEEAFDDDLEMYTKIVILPNKVGNYDIFKLEKGNDEIIITERLKQLLIKESDSHNINGIVIKNVKERYTNEKLFG